MRSDVAQSHGFRSFTLFISYSENYRLVEDQQYGPDRSLTFYIDPILYKPEVYTFFVEELKKKLQIQLHPTAFKSKLFYLFSELVFTFEGDRYYLDFLSSSIKWPMTRFIEDSVVGEKYLMQRFRRYVPLIKDITQVLSSDFFSDVYSADDFSRKQKKSHFSNFIVPYDEFDDRNWIHKDFLKPFISAYKQYKVNQPFFYWRYLFSYICHLYSEYGSYIFPLPLSHIIKLFSYFKPSLERFLYDELFPDDSYNLVHVPMSYVVSYDYLARTVIDSFSVRRFLLSP